MPSRSRITVLLVLALAVVPLALPAGGAEVTRERATVSFTLEGTATHTGTGAETNVTVHIRGPVVVMRTDHGLDYLSSRVTVTVAFEDQGRFVFRSANIVGSYSDDGGELRPERLHFYDSARRGLVTAELTGDGGGDGEGNDTAGWSGDGRFIVSARGGIRTYDLTLATG